MFEPLAQRAGEAKMPPKDEESKQNRAEDRTRDAPSKAQHDRRPPLQESESEEWRAFFVSLMTDVDKFLDGESSETSSETASRHDEGQPSTNAPDPELPQSGSDYPASDEVQRQQQQDYSETAASSNPRPLAASSSFSKQALPVEEPEPLPLTHEALQLHLAQMQTAEMREQIEARDLEVGDLNDVFPDNGESIRSVPVTASEGISTRCSMTLDFPDWAVAILRRIPACVIEVRRLFVYFFRVVGELGLPTEWQDVARWPHLQETPSFIRTWAIERWNKLKVEVILRPTITSRDELNRAMKLCIEACHGFERYYLSIFQENAYLRTSAHPSRFEYFDSECEAVELLEEHMDTFEAMRTILGSAEIEGTANEFLKRMPQFFVVLQHLNQLIFDLEI